MTMNGQEPVAFTVYDVAGHAVVSGQTGDRQIIDIGSTGSGLRICELKTGSGRIYRQTITCP